MTKKTTEQSISGKQQPSEASADHIFAETGDRADAPVSGDSSTANPAGVGEGSGSDVPRLLADAEARVLRAQADLENFRKRVRRDMDEERRYAALPFIRDLLPAIDNLGRAMDSMGDGSDAANYRAGIEMVSQQFLQILAQHGCQPIEPVNQAFDPMWHEAIGREQKSDAPAGTVVRVEQTGYRLHDRVVRPAYVVVSAGDGAE